MTVLFYLEEEKMIRKLMKVNSKIINYSINNNKKLLGICYGAEILALTLGGTIRKTESIQKGNETN